MILYHGSNQDIETIDLTKGLRYKDFGMGFLSDFRQRHSYSYGKKESTCVWWNGDTDYL